MKVDQELDGKRYRKIFRKKHALYITVWENGTGGLHAIQHSASDHEWNREHHQQSLIDWAFRATSMLLRKYPQSKIIGELRNCSLGDETIPGIIASVIEEHIEGTNGKEREGM